MHINEAHVDEWRRQGYTVVERFLSEPELRTLQTHLSAIFPTWTQYVADQYSPVPQYYGTAPGGGFFVDAPALGNELNLIACHPDLIDFVERALGTRNVQLHQAQAWGKYGGGEDFDQDLHVDYMNNSILYPAANAPEQVTAILYYGNVTLDLGPTFVVPREATRSEPLVPYIRSRSQYPVLYRYERPVLVPAGSILLYDLRTFHRGSAITNPFGMRLTHHFAYRRADAQWVGYRYWANHGLVEDWQTLIEAATPRQRELFGVPAAGHAYWNEETVVGMAARYPNMDMTPYATAAGVPMERIEAERARIAALPPTSDTTSRTGVKTRVGLVRDVVRGIRPYMPVLASYYEGMLDCYQAASKAEPTTR